MRDATRDATRDAEIQKQNHHHKGGEQIVYTKCLSCRHSRAELEIKFVHETIQKENIMKFQEGARTPAHRGGARPWYTVLFLYCEEKW